MDQCFSQFWSYSFDACQPAKQSTQLVPEYCNQINEKALYLHKPNMDNFVQMMSQYHSRDSTIQPYCLGSHSAFSGWNLVVKVFWRLLWNFDVFYLATISLCRLTIRFAWSWGQVKYLPMSTHQYTFPCKSFLVEKSEANSQLDLLPGSLTLAALGEKGGTVRKAKW